MPKIPLKSSFQQFCDRWRKGCGSDICKTAHNIVLARGRVPADIVLVGEAPGKSEDMVGQPFVGPAGKVLDGIILAALPHKVQKDDRGLDYYVPEVRYALCNLTGCIPVDEDGNKEGQPDAEDILRCKPRLEQFLEICKPRLIVCVGKLPETWLAQGYKHSVKLPGSTQKVVKIDHPAYILRQPLAQKGLSIQRCEVIIRNAYEEVFGA